MSRQASILKHIDATGVGIEIGPWFNPLAPKRDGYNCLSMDVFDTETTRARAAADPAIAHRVQDIEDVDLVGSSTDIENVVRNRFGDKKFDYVISSHNFEHLPNPIKFLKGCEAVLRPGGVVAMAVPDHRACFDFFRPLTRIGEWLDWYHRGLDKPTFAQSFEHRAMFAYYGEVGGPTSAHREQDPSAWRGPTNIDVAYADWKKQMEDGESDYLDSHCSVFTPSSFELLILDCNFLGVVELQAIEVFDAGGEFHAHLKSGGQRLDKSEYLAKRGSLMHRVKDEEAESSARYRSLSS